MTAPPVTFDADRMAVRFDSFGLESYRLFLKCKQLPETSVEFDPETESYTLSAPARFAAMLGVERPPLREKNPVWPALRPDQQILVRMALDAKRFGLWCRCGYGKTLMGLEIGRQIVYSTAGRFLVVTINDVVSEWVAEAKKWYGDALPLTRLESRTEMRQWMREGSPGIAVTNYEKFNPKRTKGGHNDDQVVPEAKYLSGCLLDENRLKTGGGVQKWAIGKSMKGVEYKFTTTATPAPNDLMEFASHAMFLEKMRSEDEIIWTFFTRDKKTHRWTVKPHARAAFFKWMSSWSIYVNDPKRYGWCLDEPEVPKPIYHVIDVPATPEQLDVARDLTADAETGQRSLIVNVETNAIQRVKLGEVAKGFLYGPDGKPIYVPSAKPGVVADLVRREATAGAQVLVWTVFDAESDMLREHLKDLGHVEFLTGRVKKKDRPAIIERYKAGTTRVLVSQASLISWGLNLQMTGAMVFSGWDDSFERLYQALRRGYRFGQKEAMRVYFPCVRELEGDTLENTQRKEAEHERSVDEMEGNYLAAGAWSVERMSAA